MADASTSLGAAIGLQGTLKDYGQQFANEINRQANLEAKRAAVQQQKNEKDRERWAKFTTVAPKTYLPTRTEAIKQKQSDLLSAIKDAKDRGADPLYDEKFRATLDDVTSYFDGAKAEYEAFNNDYKTFNLKAKDLMLKTDVYDGYSKSQLPVDAPFYGGGQMLQPRMNYSEYLTKNADKIGWVEKSIDTVMPDGKIKTEMRKVYSPENNVKFVENFMNSGFNKSDIYAEMMLKDVTNDVLNDINFANADPNEQALEVRKRFSEKALGILQASQDNLEKESLKQKGKFNINIGGGGDDANRNEGLGGDGLSVPLYNEKGDKITINGKVALGTIPIAASGAFKEIKQQLPVGDDWILWDEGPNKKVNERKQGMLNITGGYYAVVPVYKKLSGKDAKYSGFIAHNTEKKIIMDANGNIADAYKDIVEKKVMFFATAYDKSSNQLNIAIPINRPITDIATLNASGDDAAIISKNVAASKKVANKKVTDKKADGGPVSLAGEYKDKKTGKVWIADENGNFVSWK